MLLTSISIFLGLAIGLFLFSFFRLRQIQKTCEDLTQERATLLARALKAEAQAEQREALLQAQSLQFLETKSQLQTEFENQQRRLLLESQERLQNWSKDSFQTMVKPVDDDLKALQKCIVEVYDREARERLSLKTEIELMIKAQGQLSLEAQSLSQALRGDSRSQGVWGEMVLERILESSGLREGEEYVVQGRGLGLKSEDGQVRKPDVLVRLPGERHLIVDSKVSLVSYERLLKAADEVSKQQCLQEFIISIRRHVEELSAKDYAHLYKLNSPDFVLLFMPTDGAFALAHQSDPGLFTLAMEKRVAIVSPSLLFPNLRTVEAIWRQERQNRNAEEIARQAGGLYDKFVGLIEDLGLLETHLRRVEETRINIQVKLKDGRGNLLDRVENLRRLGAKTKKKLEVESFDSTEEFDSKNLI